VRTILHLTPEQVLSEGFIVERHEAGLYVELRSADLTLIGQRTLPAEGNCDELAQAAAVVLSAWLSDVHPDFAGVLPAPAPAAEPAPPPTAQPSRPPASKPPTPQPQATPLPARSPPRPLPRLEISLGVGGEVTSSGPAFAGMLGVGYIPARQGLGLSATAILSPPQQEPLGPGLVEWRRWPLDVGPNLRIADETVSWDLCVGPTLAWLRLAGANFDRPSSRDDVAVGAFLSGRLSTRGRHWGLFALAEAEFYPGDTGAHASQADVEWFTPLPGFAANLLIGGWLAP
jgi:hypothetical protein